MKGKFLKRFLFAMAFCVTFIVFSGIKAEAKELPTDSFILCTNEGSTDASTTESDTGNGGGNGLNDFKIEMDEDGNVTTSLDKQTSEGGSWNDLFERYKEAIAGVGGILTITFILFFMKNFAVLGASSNNPSARKDALTACLYTAIGAVLSGSVTLVTAIFWNFFS